MNMPPSGPRTRSSMEVLGFHKPTILPTSNPVYAPSYKWDVALFEHKSRAVSSHAIASHFGMSIADKFDPEREVIWEHFDIMFVHPTLRSVMRHLMALDMQAPLAAKILAIVLSTKFVKDNACASLMHQVWQVLVYQQILEPAFSFRDFEVFKRNFCSVAGQSDIYLWEVGLILDGILTGELRQPRSAVLELARDYKSFTGMLPPEYDKYMGPELSGRGEDSGEEEKGKINLAAGGARPKVLPSAPKFDTIQRDIFESFEKYVQEMAREQNPVTSTPNPYTNEEINPYKVQKVKKDIMQNATDQELIRKDDRIDRDTREQKINADYGVQSNVQGTRKIGTGDRLLGETKDYVNVAQKFEEMKEKIVPGGDSENVLRGPSYQPTPQLPRIRKIYVTPPDSSKDSDSDNCCAFCGRQNQGETNLCGNGKHSAQAGY